MLSRCAWYSCLLFCIVDCMIRLFERSCRDCGHCHCTVTAIVKMHICPAFSFQAASLKAIMLPIATDVTIAWSVCLSVRLSHLCTLLKPLDRMRCYLAGTIVVLNNIVLDWGHDAFTGRGDLRVRTPSQNLFCKLQPNRYR